MHVGLYLAPQTSGDAEDVSNIDAVIDQAVEADAAGFSTIYLTEHHLDDYNTYCDPHMLGAHLAGKLKQAWLATSVSLVTLHHPLRMVETFNLLDVMTKGKVVFGLAGGGGAEMYEGLGRDPQARRDGLDQTIDAMLRIWAHQPGDPPLDIETVYDHARISGRVNPRSFRQPHPMLARATNTESTIVEFARRGWPVMVGRLAPERMGHLTRVYREALETAGHSPETIRWCMQWMASTKFVFVGPTDAQAQAEAAGPMERYFKRIGNIFGPRDGTPARRLAALDGATTSREANSFDEFVRNAWVVGSPDTVLKELQAYAAQGVPQMRLWFTFGPGCTHDAFLRSLRLFIKEALPVLNPQPIWDPGTVVVGPAAAAAA
jgi:alkanesulfonate monooxygenase SsuD/methylene tetrahydromethanopterin reductase-like flavin-dependent oxidoreductase (luciferase family)